MLFQQTWGCWIQTGMVAGSVRYSGHSLSLISSHRVGALWVHTGIQFFAFDFAKTIDEFLRVREDPPRLGLVRRLTRASLVGTLVLSIDSPAAKGLYQLGTFSVTANGFVVVCSPLVAKSGPSEAEHAARSQLDRYVLFLIQSVIIKCEIQYSYKRVITLLNNVYLTASYITYIHAHCDPACAYPTAAHSIPNDNHSRLEKN